MEILSIIKAIPFIFVALLVYFGGHYFVYFSFTRFFQIDSQKAKIIVFVIFFILSLGLVFSSTIAHVSENIFSRLYYLSSVVWVGLFFYFFWFSILAWIFVGANKLLGNSLNLPLVGAVFFFLALLTVIFGIFNAFDVRVKRIEVPIKNLPITWQGKTIIQLSDVHLGMINSAGFLNQVVEKTNALNPDMIVITGDLFDGMDGDLSGFASQLDNLQAKQGIYFVTGNHETYLGAAKAFAALEKTKISVLNNEAININGLEIVGTSFPDAATGGILGKDDLKTIFSSMKDFVSGQPLILLHHAPTGIAEAKELGVNLMLSGHTHNGQLFPINFITRAIFGKYYHGLHTEGDFSIYTTSGTGTWGPPLRVGNVPEIAAIKISASQ